MRVVGFFTVFFDSSAHEICCLMICSALLTAPSPDILLPLSYHRRKVVKSSLANNFIFASRKLIKMATVDCCIYKDPNAPVEVRVKDLLSRMTLKEKIGQMTQIERAVANRDVVRDRFIGMLKDPFLPCTFTNLDS